VKKILIVALVFAASITKTDFFPFITLPKELPNLQDIGTISSFVFTQEDKNNACYILVEVFTEKKGFAPVILKKEIGDKGKWEHVETNISVSTMLLFKETIALKPLLLGKIGSQVALVALKDSFSAPNIYLYDHSKKSWRLFYDSSQKNSFIKQSSNDNIPWLTGSDTTWWIKTCDLLKKQCAVFENTKKTSYVATSVTPDNQYAWLIEPSKISIRDLTAEEEFTQEIDLPRTMPEILQLVALDDKNAFFLGSTKTKFDTKINLYTLELIYEKNEEDLSEDIKVEIKTIPVQKELIHKNSQIGIYNGMLIVRAGNQLYIYAPSKPLNITVKAEAIETSITKEPEENKVTPIELKWYTPVSSETSEKSISSKESVQGTPITIEIPHEKPSLLSQAYVFLKTKAATTVPKISITHEKSQANIIQRPEVRRQASTTSRLQNFRNWLGNISTWLWGAKKEVQKTSTLTTTSDARKELYNRPPTSPKKNIRRGGPTGK
jgi:hypothetical protein